MMQPSMATMNESIGSLHFSSTSPSPTGLSPNQTTSSTLFGSSSKQAKYVRTSFSQDHDIPHRDQNLREKKKRRKRLLQLQHIKLIQSMLCIHLFDWFFRESGGFEGFSPCCCMAVAGALIGLLLLGTLIAAIVLIGKSIVDRCTNRVDSMSRLLVDQQWSISFWSSFSHFDCELIDTSFLWF